MPTARDYLEEGARLRKLGDNDRAIAAYDTCLSSSPDPVTEMIAWDGLGPAIMFKFMFMERKGETITNEEFGWHHRIFMCLQNQVRVFDERIAHTQAASNYIRPIEGARDQLKTIYMYGGSVLCKVGGTWTQRLRDLGECANLALPPLRCLAQQEADDMAKWRQSQAASEKKPEKRGFFKSLFGD